MDFTERGRGRFEEGVEEGSVGSGVRLRGELALSAQGVRSVQQLSCVLCPVCFLCMGRCGVSLCVRRRTPPNPEG